MFFPALEEIMIQVIDGFFPYALDEKVVSAFSKLKV
jgi:hypothetical protein